MPNQFQLLVGPGQFIDALRTDLTDCHESCYAQFMSYEGDTSGHAFSALLAAKAQAGADVRLIVDGYTDVVINDAYPFLFHRWGSSTAEHRRTRRMFKDLRANGVQVRRTAPPGRLGRYMLYRNHKKMVILDERIAYVGGINISDHNYAWHDFMVRIKGPLVRDLVRDYCSTWDGRTIVLDTARPGEDFILNQTAGRYSIFEQILDMIARAQHTIAVESPYLLGDHIETALLAAAQRGVRVNAIIPAHNNKLMYRIWVRKLLRRLDHPNITVYGYRGNGGMTHAKLLLVDERWATFGSFNMIELEGLTQKELNVFSSSPDLIAQLSAFVKADLAHAAPMPIPQTAFGRFTFSLLYRFFNWWTQRLIKNPDWTERYC